MTLEDDIASFERVPTLSMLGGAALRILAIGAETRHLSSGAVLFYAGDPADGGYIVQSGSFLLEPGRPQDGDEIVIGPGALLGELAMLTDTVRLATATAQEPSTVIRISRSLFLKMLEGYPAAAKSLRDVYATQVNTWARELENVRARMEPGR